MGRHRDLKYTYKVEIYITWDGYVNNSSGYNGCHIPIFFVKWNSSGINIITTHCGVILILTIIKFYLFEFTYNKCNKKLVFMRSNFRYRWSKVEFDGTNLAFSKQFILVNFCSLNNSVLNL